MSDESLPDSGNRVLLTVTGGIAAYKSCELVRRLRDHDLHVRVAMTRAACEFVGTLTFSALSGHSVVSRLFDDPSPERFPHVRWAESADLLIVAPATADFIAKMAHGIADDFASTMALAVTAPIIVAPAMEDDMYRHPAVQRNLATLRSRGVRMVGPDSGDLASGRRGPGRMSEPASILAAALRTLRLGAAPDDLVGQRVLVTAGPTRERLDPIRFLSNRSSGKMGYALAAEAAWRGADVTLVSGPTALAAPAGVHLEEVESAAQMAQVVIDRAGDQDIVVMAAAVADFTVGEPAAQKLKKLDRDTLRLELEPTMDILSRLGERPSRPLLVGFAAETERVADNAAEKLRRKGCDLIVANEVGAGRGMGVDDNTVQIIDAMGKTTAFGPAPKPDVAAAIWDAVAELRGSTDR